MTNSSLAGVAQELVLSDEKADLPLRHDTYWL